MNGNDGTDILKTLPPEDDRIDQALRELDAKLDAWAQTILDTEAGLKALSSSTSSGESGEVAIADDAKSNITENEIETQPLAENTLLNDAAPEKAEPEIVDEIPLNLEKPSEPQQPMAQSPLIMESVAAEPVESDSTKEEDEALLATLDPDTLKKIQVLRRLTSKKRSVRELIEQVKASASGAPAPVENKKKSFWRR
jgi:hypothetical protein